MYLKSSVATWIWLILLLLPLRLDDWQLSQLTVFFAYGLFALSLAFIWGHCGLLCLGQAVFFGIGAYAMSVTTLGLLPGLDWLVSSWLGLLLAMLIPAVFANLLGRFLFFGQGLEGAFFGIVTLAVAFIAERLAINWDYLGGLNGLMGIPALNLGLNGNGYAVWDSLPLYYLTLGIVIAVFLLLSALINSPYGVVLKAIRESETRTRFFGYDAASYKVTAFTISAAIAGLAGALFVTQFGFASPPLIGFGLSAEVLIWVAVGGRGMLLAAFLGTLLVRYLEDILAETLGAYWLLALGFLFVFCVMYFPRGLFGELLYRLGRFTNRPATHPT